MLKYLIGFVLIYLQPVSSVLIPQSDVEAATRLQSARGQYTIQFSTTPHPIPLNQVFSLEVQVTPKQGISDQDFQLSVDARMPQHRHGMVRQPKLTSLGGGKFRVDEMLFHMPGRWELYFDMTAKGMTERARAVVILE